MRATNQNWWLDWYLYCILEDVFGMMRNSTWLVFFKYSSPLTTSSCFSSFSPSIKVSLVPIHIYPPFFHTSCIFLYLPVSSFSPSLVASPTPNTTIPLSQHFSGRRKWSTEPPTSDAFRAAPGWLRQGNPQQNQWIYGCLHSTESYHKIPVFCCICCIQNMTEV